MLDVSETAVLKGFDLGARCGGVDLPPRAHTMARRRKLGAQLTAGADDGACVGRQVGARRLDNIADCVRAVSSAGIPGDLVETGVWRGGAVAYMKVMMCFLLMHA